MTPPPAIARALIGDQLIRSTRTKIRHTQHLQRLERKDLFKGNTPENRTFQVMFLHVQNAQTIFNTGNQTEAPSKPETFENQPDFLQK